jgi:anti-sigma B factor antagonist
MTAMGRRLRRGMDAFRGRIGLRHPRAAVGPTYPATARPFAVEASVDAGEAIVAVSGEVDISTAARLRDALHDLPGERLIVDLCGVSFMDSTGLGVLLAARAERPGGRLAIVCPPGPVRLLFEVSGVDGELPLYDSRAALRDAS